MPTPVYADTSFLVSLYVQDANSPDAVRRAGDLVPLLLTPVGEHELRNAIRLCVFRRQITAAQRDHAFHDLEADKSGGVLHATTLDWPKTLQRAEALGRRHTEALGARGMDVIHVAAALTLRTKRFVTFDDRQRQLAKAAGLEII